MSAAAVPSPAGLRPSVNAGCTLATVRSVLLGVGAQVAISAAEPTAGPVGGSDAVQVRGVTLDSRDVRPADLYAALPGARAHGAQFAVEVQRRGAAALLTDRDGARLARDSGCDLPLVVVAEPRAVLGEVAAEVYGRPADQVRLLGVTGTNGKTTTTYLMDAVLRAAGVTTGLVGTVETRVADRRVPSVRTTPEAPQLHALLAAMREQGVQTCSMEVSSQALVQHRVDAVVVDVAGFTNFSQDHLELHGDMATYLAAKELLLTPAHSRHAVVVVDDDGSRQAAARAGVPVTTLSARPGADADWLIGGLRPRSGGTDFLLRARDAPGEPLRLRCPLPGQFNVLNAALAAVILLEHGLDTRTVQHGLAGAGGVPGRMEQVAGPLGGPLAVVDYAHTPQAVAAALQALRPAVTGRLVVVLGAGGDRDPAKRAAMGRAAAEGADVLVVTDDNPRGEDPALIRAELLAGARSVAAPQRAEVVEVADRGAAIRAAVRYARSTGDVVLVAGKGHEPGQELAGVVHPFDDRQELAAALDEEQS